MLRSSFACQYSCLDVGLAAALHRSCWCQKQPCTKITVRYLGKTMSGLPGRSLRCSLKRNPAPCRSRRTVSSGLVFWLFTAAIVLRRCSGVRTSISIGATNRGPLRLVEYSWSVLIARKALNVGPFHARFNLNTDSLVLGNRERLRKNI